jgi:hypothetical protein
MSLQKASDRLFAPITFFPAVTRSFVLGNLVLVAHRRPPDSQKG